MKQLDVPGMGLFIDKLVGVTVVSPSDIAIDSWIGGIALVRDDKAAKPALIRRDAQPEHRFVASKWSGGDGPGDNGPSADLPARNGELGPVLGDRRPGRRHRHATSPYPR